MSILKKYRVTEDAKKKPGMEFGDLGFIEWDKITERQMERLVAVKFRFVELIPTKVAEAPTVKEAPKQ